MSKLVGSIALAIAFLVTGASARTSAPVRLPPDVELLSPFGERAAFSPDGRSVAFIGKSYGDAFEIDLKSRKVRNLTSRFGHAGFLRISYLATGDYLLQGPEHNIGPNSRLVLQTYYLRSDLRSAPQPLGQSGYEGIALGPRGLMAWQQIPDGEGLRPGETWITAMSRAGLQHYVATLTIKQGRATLSNKQRILEQLPDGCVYTEVQDFRDNGNEIVFYCAGRGSGGAAQLGVYGYNFTSRRFIPYVPLGMRYVEVEGVAPDGRWAAVECGPETAPAAAQGGSAEPRRLDICRLELREGGTIAELVRASEIGDRARVSNPVISPDGKWMAFQSAEPGQPAGEGSGIYLKRLSR